MKEVLTRFEAFLSTIPLDRYRSELEPVKTVEQDLPRELNPLPAIYSNYWVNEPTEFPNYEDFFHSWWTEHLRPLDAFIRKYFWGCSHAFVCLGFKARIYRTLISVLTQFHFSYTWLAYCRLPLEASADLDMRGIDALVHHDEWTVALQIKKETYRAEARERGRFAHRVLHANFTVSVPYTLTKPDEWQRRIERARNPERRRQYELLAMLAVKFQRWLPNGFVVFQPAYPRLTECLI
ncbi:MAG: TaqI family restriction endonuclease [Candidatus Fervidibacter sp.]|uniref:TaqI family restriction endonuclease n=1 Tax=Candidatus Fervidibacter sp. TaxID=3100871 RepID=UPI004049D730